jgi:hypothetical protein
MSSENKIRSQRFFLSSQESEAARAKIKENVSQASNTGCWIWNLSVVRNGYGQVQITRKKYIVHRLAFAAFNGEIPEGMFVCHSCDNRRCCNPEHLFLGTNSDNMIDSIRKGRFRRQKLSIQSVRSIFRRKAEGERVEHIASVFRTTVAQVYSILSGNSWKHVYDELEGKTLTL